VIDRHRSSGGDSVDETQMLGMDYQIWSYIALEHLCRALLARGIDDRGGMARNEVKDLFREASHG
jgi:hypothetical protein